jgi:hypothetical protein
MHRITLKDCVIWAAIIAGSLAIQLGAYWYSERDLKLACAVRGGEYITTGFTRSNVCKELKK